MKVRNDHKFAVLFGGYFLSPTSTAEVPDSMLEEAEAKNLTILEAPEKPTPSKGRKPARKGSVDNSNAPDAVEDSKE